MTFYCSAFALGDNPGDLPIPGDIPGDLPTPGDVPTTHPGDVPTDLPYDPPFEGPQSTFVQNTDVLPKVTDDEAENWNENTGQLDGIQLFADTEGKVTIVDFDKVFTEDGKTYVVETKSVANPNDPSYDENDRQTDNDWVKRMLTEGREQTNKSGVTTFKQGQLDAYVDALTNGKNVPDEIANAVKNGTVQIGIEFTNPNMTDSLKQAVEEEVAAWERNHPGWHVAISYP